MEARLKTSIQVKALIRRCDLAAIGVAVTARGDPDAGAILVKLCGRDGSAAVLVTQARRADGTIRLAARDGRRANGPESDADAYIARQRQRDPDLWVVRNRDRHAYHRARRRHHRMIDFQ